MTHTVPTAAPSPRGWRRFWIAGVALGLLIFIPAVYFGFRLNPQRRLEQQIAAYRAAGEPVVPEDFEGGPPPPDDANAAIPLRRAADAIRMTPAQEKTFDFRFEAKLPLLEEEASLLRELEPLLPAVLAEVEQAHQRREVFWGSYFQGDPAQRSFPHLVEMRKLTRFLLAMALLAHSDGDSETAITLCLDVWHIAQAVDRGDVVAHLVAMAILGNLSDALQQMSPDLRANSDEHKAAISQLILHLLDDAQRRDAAARAWNMERAACLWQMQTLGVGPARSTLQRASSQILPAHALGRRAASAPDHPTAQVILAQLPASYGSGGAAAVLAESVAAVVRRAPEQEFWNLVDRRLTATLLALRLYQVDHEGRFPKALSELVPLYLPQVPQDPYRNDGAPLGYLSATPPAVYTVWLNGADDRGDSTTPVLAGSGAPDERKAPDRVARLAREPRVRPAEWDEPLEPADE